MNEIDYLFPKITRGIDLTNTNLELKMTKKPLIDCLDVFKLEGYKWVHETRRKVANKLFLTKYIRR